MLMIRWILITIVLTTTASMLVIAVLRFFRPRSEVAVLVENVLDLAIVAGYKDFEGPEGVRLDKKLEDLAKDKSGAAEEASIILLAYSLGEHNAEVQECAATIRGPKVVEMLKKYRRMPPVPWKPRYLVLKLPKESRESMYDTALDAIQHGKVLCD